GGGGSARATRLRDVRPAGGDGPVLLPERAIDRAARLTGGGQTVAPVPGGPAVVRGVGGARGVVEALSSLAHPVADEGVEEDLRSRPGVVGGVPAEAVGIEEPAPHADVDLHEPDVAGPGEEEGHGVASTDELAPAALLPGHGLQERVEEVVVALVEDVGV